MSKRKRADSMRPKAQLREEQSKVIARSEWDSLMHSTHNKMSEGASQVNKIINRARKDNWRRKNEKKSKKS